MNRNRYNDYRAYDDESNRMKHYEKAYRTFNQAFKSLKKLKKCNLDEFIEANSYFSMSQEEISSLFQAIQSPEEFRNVFEALGLAETKFKLIDKAPTLTKLERDKINNDLLQIWLDLDKTPELPDILPKTSLEALISPKYPKGPDFAKITNFKNIYEDPRKDPRYKYQSSPFKAPRNEIERDYEEFLDKIKVHNNEEPNLRNFKPKVTQSLPKLQSVNKAFRPYFFNSKDENQASPSKNQEYNHERALKNWAKVKSIMKLSIMNLNGIKGGVTQKLK